MIFLFLGAAAHASLHDVTDSSACLHDNFEEAQIRFIAYSMDSR
jgi:hypothetical protein